MHGGLDSEKISCIEAILYSEDLNEATKQVASIGDSEMLYVLAANYNWDNGFSIPRAIITNNNCDMSTGLMMFYLSDGIRLLVDKESVEQSGLDEWSKFITEVYSKLEMDVFKRSSISYYPELTKVQLFKLKKSNPNIPGFFLDGIEGNDIEIPMI
ncbi:DUF4274 domain-containing protein [Listeria sp. FSL L7-1582]|uniref:DUF4274 domain-containing protein n=2 Tax=Listeria weihenstephanensis TaxID=1006155 RepID=A0A1S7FSB2_9LIST|nr:MULTISPECIES: DUF4274 domain-containing protein [Listeria]AQY50282.1 hypothetical protein UE46_04060 [Listeria weihenstephanensis]EUJ40901.1 hypothetical protein PWEIH_02604 [Listeria weihenstephanensis FSL R9-0317]MBC6309173.1 DUF4274 domain-containing protein [Listeria portnoyi]